MMQIVCLANSRKNRNRCIAGMTDEGMWVRPVSTLSDGSITRPMREIDGREPQLLEVLEIPLEKNCPDIHHQRENRLLKPGKWKCVETVDVSDVLPLCEEKRFLLHTDSDRVPSQLITDLAPGKRRSLQLISVDDAWFHMKTSMRCSQQIRVAFSYSSNRYDIVVTDPLAEAIVAKDEEKIGSRCILTVSMGGPYDDGNYYKFVAAVIER